MKYNAIFLLDKEPGKTDAKLRYRIKWAGNTVAFGVGYRVEIDKWSAKTQRCVNNSTHGKKKISASIINRQIAKFERITEEVFNHFVNSNKMVSASDFRAEFNRRNGKVDKYTNQLNNSFFGLLESFKKDMGFVNMWTEATYQKFDALKSHIESFNTKITFEDFTETGLNNFVHHLLTKRNLRNTTIGKQIGFLKWFLKWATSKGYNKELSFVDFSPKLKTTQKKVVFLDWDELMKVCNFDLKSPALSRVRDVFCFCCFTGLRYSDVANLKRSDVFATYISLTTVKTSDSLLIELNKYSATILAKYKDVEFEKNRALPVISNQKMNDAIKDLGKLCGIDTPTTVTYYKGNTRHDEVFPKYALLGTHTGRRTFICNALMLGISPHVVMKWTGHSDYKSMKPYIGIADKTKEAAMRMFDKKD